MDIGIQMERLDGDVGSGQAALQARPKVLDAVRVDVPVHIFNGVVDDVADREFQENRRW